MSFETERLAIEKVLSDCRVHIDSPWNQLKKNILFKAITELAYHTTLALKDLRDEQQQELQELRAEQAVLLDAVLSRLPETVLEPLAEGQKSALEAIVSRRVGESMTTIIEQVVQQLRPMMGPYHRNNEYR